MIVDRTSSKNFRVGKSANSFITLEIYKRIEAKEFFYLDNVVRRGLTHLFWY